VNTSNIVISDAQYIVKPPKDLVLRVIFNDQFSDCIVAQRNKLNLTQEELAKRSGVSRVTIAKIETKQRLAGADVVLKLLDALNLEICFREQME
jgi:DNA-binding XRE family transcriptional regulator